MKPREAAQRVFHEVLSDNAFSNEALSKCFADAPELSAQDRRFTEHLTRASLAHYLSLLELLRAVSSVRPEKMKPAVREILLLGSTELLLMRTPDYAAIHEYVELTKKAGYRGLSGFVNAVLRRIAREGQEILEQQTGALKEGLPDELYEDINRWYGEERADKIFAWFKKDQSDGIWIRRNQSCISDEGLMTCLSMEEREAVPSGITEDTYLLKNAGNLTESAAFNNGLYTVQDLSSALSGEIVKDLFRPELKSFFVLDACASPGGKSMHAADLMEYSMPKAEKTLVSCDISEWKTGRIRENIERCAFSFVTPRVQDASLLCEEFLDRFHLVILDVPCSGIGVIAKRPEIRFHAGRKERESLAALQKTILETNARYVRPGGTLLYSTCTIAPEENLMQVRAFLDGHPGFRLRGFRELISERIPDAESAEDGYLQILPGSIGSDGFFMARMERTE